VKLPLKDRNQRQHFCAPDAPRREPDGDFLLLRKTVDQDIARLARPDRVRVKLRCCAKQRSI